jgi:hypothetical protein
MMSRKWRFLFIMAIAPLIFTRILPSVPIHTPIIMFVWYIYDWKTALILEAWHDLVILPQIIWYYQWVNNISFIPFQNNYSSIAIIDLLNQTFPTHSRYATANLTTGEGIMLDNTMKWIYRIWGPTNPILIEYLGQRVLKKKFDKKLQILKLLAPL